MGLIWDIFKALASDNSSNKNSKLEKEMELDEDDFYYDK